MRYADESAALRKSPSPNPLEGLCLVTTPRCGGHSRPEALASSGASLKQGRGPQPHRLLYLPKPQVARMAGHG